MDAKAGGDGYLWSQNPSRGTMQKGPYHRQAHRQAPQWSMCYSPRKRTSGHVVSQLQARPLFTVCHRTACREGRAIKARSRPPQHGHQDCRNSSITSGPHRSCGGVWPYRPGDQRHTARLHRRGDQGNRAAGEAGGPAGVGPGQVPRHSGHGMLGGDGS